MARSSGDASSETDHLNDAYSSRSRRSHGRPLNSKVESLTTALQDTNRNLRAVDKMFEEYKDIGEQQSTAMGRLKDDLAKTSSRLRDEKMRKSHRGRESTRGLRRSDLDDDYSRARRKQRRGPTSPHRDYEKSFSDIEYGDYDEQGHHQYRAGVRFYDDMDASHHLHDLHQSVRDLTSDQLRMEADLNREVDRRNRLEHEHKKVLHNLDKRPAVETALSSVDQRLQSIQDELRAERALIRKKQEETGKVSTELRQALEQQKSTTQPKTMTLSPEEQELRVRLGQSESHRQTVESELLKLRRKFDQSEGGRNAVIEQVEELRRQLSRAEEERKHLRNQLSDQESGLNERKRKLAKEERDLEYSERERRRLEEELRELRSQLGKSAAVVGEYRELQQELERSERQREQLSDHIQVLNKDLEDKEKQNAKVITQYQQTSEQCEETERHKRQTLIELESTLKKLREVTREAESLSTELKETQQALRESEHRREDIKNRAQDTVRQWKVKCKQLEREADRFKHSSQQSSQRGEELVRELELTRSHQGNSVQQLEHLKRELNDLLGMRAQQDEQLRIRDIEVNELKSFKMDMEKDLRDCKVVIERMEHELHSAQERYRATVDEKTRLEEQQAAMQSAQMMMQSQAQQMQRELKEVNVMKVEMAGQLADIANERQELRASLQEARRGEATAREEIQVLVNRFKEEKEFGNRRLDSVQVELEKYKHHESLKIQDMSKRMKKSQAEYEAEIQALKLEVQEERSAGKLFRKQQDKLKEEVERLNAELARNQEEMTDMQCKYHRVREEFLSKSQLTEDGLSRAREVELDLMDTRELLRRMEKDHQNILHTLAAEIDCVIEEAAAESAETIKALSMTKGLSSEPQKLLAELKSKLNWLKSELHTKREKEEKLRLDMRDVMLNTEKDRQFLVAELDRQNEVMDQLSTSTKREQYENDLQNNHRISEELEDENFEMNGENMAYIEQQKITNLEREKQNGALEMTPIKDGTTNKERERIHERYSRLQETMNSLRQELTDSRLRTELAKDPLLNGDSAHNAYPPVTPPRKSCLKVRISSPPTQARTPPRRRSRTPSPSKTPPPLSLTDEEFLERFVPKSPQFQGHQGKSSAL